jgi:hypothetical protein
VACRQTDFSLTVAYPQMEVWPLVSRVAAYRAGTQPLALQRRMEWEPQAGTTRDFFQVCFLIRASFAVVALRQD